MTGESERGMENEELEAGNAQDRNGTMNLACPSVEQASTHSHAPCALAVLGKGTCRTVFCCVDYL